VSALQVTGLRVELTQLQVQPGRGAVAVGTGQFETYPVQLVLKSIGYKSLPLEGVAFDQRAGVIPNTSGRVLTGEAVCRQSMITAEADLGVLAEADLGVFWAGGCRSVLSAGVEQGRRSSK
jgi:adrenodoxin-NADP+ reductase